MFLSYEAALANALPEAAFVRGSTSRKLARNLEELPPEGLSGSPMATKTKHNPS